MKTVESISIFSFSILIQYQCCRIDMISINHQNNTILNIIEFETGVKSAHIYPFHNIFFRFFSNIHNIPLGYENCTWHYL